MSQSQSPPAIIRLADGTSVPHEIGVQVYNYYDFKSGVIERLADQSEPDTSGLLLDGLAWWVGVRHDDGSHAYLDGSRMCSIEFATKKGWIQ